jgi:hypothetical protein
MATGQQLACLPRKGDVELAFSRDSRLLVSADGDGLHLWVAATWKSAGTIALPTETKVDVHNLFANHFMNDACPG